MRVSPTSNPASRSAPPRSRSVLAAARGWIIVALAWAAAGCDSRAPVVLYCAQDQTYAEPILRRFTEETGIPVRALYDSEAVKTVGLAKRLLRERARPQCDVFWGNEELRARQLAAAGIFRTNPAWVAFGQRHRCLVRYSPGAANAPPQITLAELTNAVWSNRVALALPLFGTTATHFLTLRQQWGSNRWATWCRQLAANRPWVVEGNSSVVALVGRGQAQIGLTDSDDVLAGQRLGYPIQAIPLRADGLAIPNTLGLIQGGPHPAEGSRLFEYLQRPDVGQILVEHGALASTTPPVHPPADEGVWAGVLQEMEAGLALLQGWFLP
jgi:iron(III) transport system substrate-binding protein